MGRRALNQQQGGGTERWGKGKRAEETSRRFAFKKRMLALKKKASDLAELCYVTVCWVCFGPDGEVVTWPENQTTVRNIIGIFQGLGEKQKRKQSYDFFRVLRDKKRKLEGEVNGRNFNTQLLGNFSREELENLSCKLELKSQAVYDRINSLKNQIGREKGKAIQVYKFTDLFSAQTVQIQHDEAESSQSGRYRKIGENPLMSAPNSFNGDLFSSKEVQSPRDASQLAQCDHDGYGKFEQNSIMGSPSTFSNGDLSKSQFLLLDDPSFDYVNDHTTQCNDQKYEDWLLDYGFSANEIGTTGTDDDNLVPENSVEISVGWTDEDIDAFLNPGCPSLSSEDVMKYVTSDNYNNINNVLCRDMALSEGSSIDQACPVSMLKPWEPMESRQTCPSWL